MNQLTEEKFVRIVEENSNLLLKIAYSYTKNEFNSQDVVQEAFIKLYRARKEFKSDEHIKNWLIRVVINGCLDILKHNKKELLIDNEYINNLPDTSDADEKNEEIWHCVCKLKESYKTIIILYYYDNYSIKEIASILNVSEGNVKMRLSRGREKLRKIIEERKKKNGK